MKKIQAANTTGRSTTAADHDIPEIGTKAYTAKQIDALVKGCAKHDAALGDLINACGYAKSKATGTSTRVTMEMKPVPKPLNHIFKTMELQMDLYPAMEHDGKIVTQVYADVNWESERGSNGLLVTRTFFCWNDNTLIKG